MGARPGGARREPHAALSRRPRPRPRRPAPVHAGPAPLRALRQRHDGAVGDAKSRRHGDRYVCYGRVTHGVDYCPMTPIPREAIDAPALAYFEWAYLDT